MCCSKIHPLPVTHTVHVSLMDHNLEIKKLHKYLAIGVEINLTMSWSSHIQTVSTATKVLNFIKQNLTNCPSGTKRTAHLTLLWNMLP